MKKLMCEMDGHSGQWFPCSLLYTAPVVQQMVREATHCCRCPDSTQIVADTVEDAKLIPPLVSVFFFPS